MGDFRLRQPRVQIFFVMSIVQISFVRSVVKICVRSTVQIFRVKSTIRFSPCMRFAPARPGVSHVTNCQSRLKALGARKPKVRRDPSQNLWSLVCVSSGMVKL